ncbi:hypothetical protein H2198_001882 [Neophaeococcomyces mojaviensis]|uniref:Uncharacterized protein n=1 Tax=Neophaeococcomyces mojaviensis TaxID=3383035 RepID=A0ACC3AG34_9EURO|nr:hypothetical protein H2198_001882 [Knufia sp. JES_112]
MVYLCNDRRLGPQIFPWQFPLLSFVSNYERFGQKTPKQFLAEYWDPTKKDKNGIVVGGWMYGGENDDGFLRIPDPKNGVNATKLFASPMTLPVGLKVDRFGSEYGTFIAAADAPFAQRSLPPDALNTCKDATKCTPDEQAHPQAYHIYTVIKELPVCGGPAAPWFEQPGLGTQFDIKNAIPDKVKQNGKTTISDLIDAKYLQKEDLSKIPPGSGPQKLIGCPC